MTLPRGTAIVLGGSVAGLVAARVLADHFPRVLLVERDAYPPGTEEVRRGLPQAHHQHLLLVKGRQILEGLFPGLDGDLAALGAPRVDYTRDCVLCSPAGRLPRFPSGLELRLCRRPMLDFVLCRRLEALSGITILQGRRATRLVEADGRIVGLGLEPEEVLEADLVVDASGRGSRTPRWLEALGFQAPERQVIDPFLGYASRLYRPGPPAVDWKAVEIASRPPHNPRAAGLWEVEGGRWLLTLIGTQGAYPPPDEEGFLEFARQLPDPIVHAAIRDAEPLSPIRGYRGLASVWNHYEKLARFPDGLVVLGDALCAFNPTHGQGMTVAALGAQILGGELGRAGGALQGLGPRVHRKMGRLVAPIWALATLDDLRWPGTLGGPPSPATRLLHALWDRVLPLAPRSPALVEAFLSVANLVKPPRALLDPRLLAQLLRLWLVPGRAP